jgi:hypothetical protein
MADEHPADEIIKPIHDAIAGILTGDSLKQTLREAWDRIHNGVTNAVPSAHDQEIQQMNKKMNDDAVKSANKSYITEDAAAKIRDAAKSRMGK